MDHRLVLLLLVPAAVLLVWLLRTLRCGPAASILLGLVTVAGVWGLLYATFNIIAFWEFFQPKEVFTSVDAMMEGTENDWLMRYIATMFGWVLGMFYFGVCWAVAFVWRAESLSEMP